MLEEGGPDGQLGEVGEVLGHAGAVGAGFEDVELGGDVGELEGVVEGGGVEGADGFVVRVGVEEAGRGVFGDVEDGGGVVEKGLRCVFAEEGLHGEDAGDVGGEREAGVAEDGEVGVGGDFVDGVVLDDFGVGGEGVGDLLQRGEVAGHVAAGGEAPDADGVGLDVPFFGVGTDVADGSDAVHERNGVHVARADSVLEDVGADAVVVEPAGFDAAFFFEDDVVVSAAGDDDDGGVRAGAGGGIAEEAWGVGFFFALGEGDVAGGPEGFDGGEAFGRGVLGVGCGG